jgi:hypothetical protein
MGFNNKGYSYEKLGNENEALICYNNCLEINSEHIMALGSRA